MATNEDPSSLKVKPSYTVITSFKNILLPVDLTANTDLGLKKALDLIDQDHSTLHILHVTKYLPARNHVNTNDSERPTITKSRDGYSLTELKLEQIRQSIQESHPEIHVQIHLISNLFIQKKIIQVASVLEPDIIIIAKSSNRRWFSFFKKIEPGFLAEITNSAILTVKPGAMNEKIKSIVIPIRSFIPKRKFEILFPFLKKKNIIVYLVSLINEDGGFDYSAASFAFIETFRILKDRVNCQVIHKLVSSHNIGRTVLNFAQSVHADVLLVNPEENMISKFLDLDIVDRLKSNSSLQVLAVDPQEKMALEY